MLNPDYLLVNTGLMGAGSPLLDSNENPNPAVVLSAASTPVTYTFEVTGQCNQRCLGCGNVGLLDRNSRHMTRKDWNVLLQRISPYAHYVRVTGGECTLHPDFRGIIQDLDDTGISYAIFTNGLWPDSDDLVAFLVRLRHLSSLLISLHGADAKTHEGFTRTGFFDRITDSIRRASAAGLVVDTNTVITSSSCTEIEAIANFSAALGARCATFSRYYGVSIPVVEPNDRELADAIRTVDHLRTEGRAVRLNPCVPQCFAPSSAKGCGAGITACTIDPRGEVRPCNHAPARLGNLLEQDIREIWSSPEALKWRSLIPVACVSCTALADCRGGCRATASQRNLSSDPLMRAPRVQPPNVIRRIYADLRPVPRFSVRLESQGALLLRLNQVTAVTSEGLAIAEAMDGHLTLADLRQWFGQEAVSLAVYLYDQGLVELAES